MKNLLKYVFPKHKVKLVKLTLGGKEYTLSKLPSSALLQIKSDLDLIRRSQSSTPDSKEMAAVSHIVHVALLQNHPEITIEEVEGLLNPENMGRVFQVVGKAILGK